MLALNYLVPLSLIVVVLLAIVTTSYRQTLFAYPSGGGSYIVSRENLGVTPALVAGGSLLVDYVLTVAVSVSAGVAAITSAFPSTQELRVPMCIFFVALMTVGNLRGVKESGRLFAGPTYVYVFALSSLILVGLFRSYFGNLGALPVNQEALDQVTKNGSLLTGITLFALLRAFSSGAVALSGVEAISNGVPAFRSPEPRNAAAHAHVDGDDPRQHVLRHLGARAPPAADRVRERDAAVDHGQGRLRLGLRLLLRPPVLDVRDLDPRGEHCVRRLPAAVVDHRERRLPPAPAREPRRPPRLLERRAGAGGRGDAADHRVRRQDLRPDPALRGRGVHRVHAVADRAWSSTITSSESRDGSRSSSINAVGAVATGIVLTVVVVSKFTIGAWIPVVLIPLIVMALKAIGRHYKHVERETTIEPEWKPRRYTHNVVVLVGRLNKPTLQALTYARSLAPDRLSAVTVVASPEEQQELQKAWDELAPPIPLEFLHSPYRELTGPVLSYLDELDAENPDEIITVVIPEVVVSHWYAQPLHNQSALALKARLLFRPNTVVTSVPTLVE